MEAEEVYREVDMQMTVREYTRGDVGAMSALWLRVFGDSERYVADFFRLLPDTGSAAVAVGPDGTLAGMAAALTGYELVEKRKTRICGYIYAVAVDEARRGAGLGAELSRAAADICRRRGAEIVATLPAEESLYAWYEKTAGLSERLYRKKRVVPAEKKVDIMQLSTTEYMLWRERYLQGRTFMRLSYPMLETQHALLRAYGGGFYASSDGVFAACRGEKSAEIKELLCPQGFEADTAASAAELLGCREAVYFEPSAAGGESYICSDRPLAAEAHWQLTLD